jgi:hypothetical protein
MLWVPSPSQIVETSGADPCLRMVLQHDVVGARVDHQVTFHLQETVGSIEELPEALQMRIVCHLLLTHLPDRGIPEACEMLARAYEFYAAASPPALSAPIERRRFKAQVAKPSPRPGFQLTEE